MAAFKCKMCGGALDVAEGESIITCGFCDTKQTLPKLGDDRKATLYDRAGHFRRGNEYDKASAIYETILNEDSTDAEAYWSIVLCKYGVEYVEDPVTRRRVPTCNRTQLTSILADENYKQAIENAEGLARSIYEEEARAIDAIQRGILEISNKEEPFDVFICYKELGEDGQRTRESVLAQDIYQQLTKDGYKVFFSRITLEKKLGQQYEPYIFAALNSAMVMLVVGTKPEHFNAVWVKNEWSRFLALAKDGGGKLLIPCYRDMDVYDLPDELSMLQSQDMGKIGFLQDLMHGVKKVLDTGKPSAGAAPTAASSAASGATGSGGANTSSSPTVDALLRRAFIFLEDGDWKQADEYCERVLDAEPENARAYIGKLCAELNVHREADLPNIEVKVESKPVEYPDVNDLLARGLKSSATLLYHAKMRTLVTVKDAEKYIENLEAEADNALPEAPLRGYSNYNKALRFAEPEYLAVLEGYEQTLLERIKAEHESNTKKGEISPLIISSIDDLQDFPLKASDISAGKICLYRRRAKGYRGDLRHEDAVDMVDSKRDKSYLEVADRFDLTAAAITELRYESLVQQKEGASGSGAGYIVALADGFKELGDYRDSRAMEAELRYESLLQQKEGASESAPGDIAALADGFKELGDYKDSKAMEAELRNLASKIMDKAWGEEYNRLVSEKEAASGGTDIKTLSTLTDLHGRFLKLHGYRDSKAMADECKNMANAIIEKEKSEIMEIKEKSYRDFVISFNNAKTAEKSSSLLTSLADSFKKMNGYKDSDKLEEELRRMAAEALEREEELENELRRKATEALEKKKEAEQRERQASWKEQGLCIMCGGQLGGLLTKKCKSCGTEQRRS